MIDQPALAPSSVLAFVTTIHAAMVVLRLHRGRLPGVLLLALPSLAFAAMAWVLTTTAGLALGLIAHVTWFVACETLAPHFRQGSREQPSRAQLAGRRLAGGLPAGDRLPHGQLPTGQLRPDSGDFFQVPVVAVHDETSDVRTFRLARPEGFDFQAGQFLTVRVQADGRTLTRCYSVSSSPETSGYLEISVKRQGVVSGLLHTTLRPGSLLAIRRPAGPFVYPPADDRPLVLLAGGIGITPLLSMLRHAVWCQPTRRVTLLYSVRSHTELAFADELSLLARRHPQARVVVTVTGHPPVDLYRHGRIDGALLRETVPDLAGSLFFMCGPLPMIDTLRALLEQLGVPPTQIHAEAFAAAAAGAAAPVDAHAPATGPGARVMFSRSRRDIETNGRESLLEAAERAGVDIPSMCRAGACGTCRTRLVSGDARCASGCLGDRERAQGWVLPCVTQPAGDCVLEA
ncbi:MAG: iron-sulfur cluster-binding domain-containing protein [Acidobacteria bacterium]|nr:MAG: iron-sulfur cluster-binding domain-containing protein [Acidobacteriota bacterium]RPJ85001.1 MAG: iron-sulfur cluster-binding domain-containing protein [Acidobacteriota bacterium]